jgi:GT2 family glycosyltransferase
MTVNNPTKKAAIAIVTYNSAGKLPDLLASLSAQDYPRELVDFIAVDNNSADDSVKILENSAISFRIIQTGENTGFCGGNNRAYELAKELQDDYLVLLNDDTIVEPDWLTKLIATAESDESVAAVQAKLMLYPEKELINSYGNALTFLSFAYCNGYRQPDKPTTPPFEVAYPSGAAVAIKMSALGQTGLFDEKFFMYHDDVDLGWRLCLAGFKILLEPAAVVYHKYSFSQADYKYEHMEQNRLFVYFKNFRLATLLIFAPAFVVMETGICLFAIKNSWFKFKLKGYGWLISNFSYLLDERKKIKQLRKVSDKEILKLVVASIKFQDVDNFLLTKIVNPVMEVYFWLAKLVIFW